MDRSTGLDARLNYAALVADGVFLLKDGSFLAGYMVEGPDHSSASMSVRDHHAEMTNTAFKALGGGITIFYDLISVPALRYISEDACHFPDPSSKAIDRERRMQFGEGGLKVYDRRTVMCIQYTPPSRHQSKIASLFFDEGNVRPKHSMTRILEAFEKKLAVFENLAAAVCKLSRMNRYAQNRCNLVNYVNFRITGKLYEVHVADDSVYLDGLLGYKKFHTAAPIMLAGEFLQCIVIDGFPDFGNPGILNGLATIPAPLIWSTRFIMMERAEALHEIKKNEQAWHVKVNGMLATAVRYEVKRPDLDALEMEQEAANARKEASSGRAASGWWTSVVVLRGSDLDELNELSDTVVKVLAEAGFGARVEDFNAADAWIGTLPGHRKENVRRPQMDTMNLAHMLPLETMWLGEPENPCDLLPAGSPPLSVAVTNGSTPCNVNLHVKDVGNTIVWGPTGAGKSALLNFLATQEFRYEGTRVWARDYKFSMYATAKACGWSHYDLGNPGELSFCPLADIDDPEGLMSASSWIDDRFESKVGRQPNAQQGKRIMKALSLLRASSLRSLSDFIALVQDAEVRDALGHFSMTGPAGMLLDSKTDTLTTDVSAVFECERFLTNAPKEIVSAVFSHLNSKFLRGLDGRPFAMYIDEAHVYLGDKFMAKDIALALRVVRSKNGHLVLATQAPDDALDSDVGTLLREACKTKIALPNPDAGDSGTKARPGPRDYLYMLGFNDADIETIRTATPKQDYYIKSERNRRLVNFNFGPVARALVCATSEADVARIRANPDWYKELVA